MRVATCDPRELLHKVVHGHFFYLAISESRLDDTKSQPRRSPRLPAVPLPITPTPTAKTVVSESQSSSGKGKKQKFNIKPRFS